MLIVGMLLRKAMKGELDLMGPATTVGKELMDIPSFDTPDYSTPLSMELDIIKGLKKSILMVAGKAVETFGMELDQQQEILMAAADMIIETYAAESAVLRALKMAQNDHKDTSVAIASAQLTVYRSAERVGLAGREAIYSFASGDEQRVMLMGLKRFTKYPEPINPKAVRDVIADAVLGSA
jgi:hypothetical protein